MTTAPIALDNQGADTGRLQQLPSGRSVVLRLTGGVEEIEVRSPSGEVEVQITLTDNGPVVRLRAAQLELESVGEMTLNCQRLKVQTTEATELHTAGELRLRSEDDMHLNGKIIHLN